MDALKAELKPDPTLLTPGGGEKKPKKDDFAVRLSAFLLSSDSDDLRMLLDVGVSEVDEIPIQESFGLDGIIFVKKKPSEIKRPPWASYLDGLHGSQVKGLETLSSSAVLLLRIDKKVVAFSFGYGRYMLNEGALMPDFGIKTALNTLNHDTLRSVDLFSIEHEPIQRRSQAVKSANINSFGVDVSRDVLKAVTGNPVKNIDWSTISGGGPQYSFTAKIKSYGDLQKIAKKLLDAYALSDYTDRFAWVDNIQRVTNPSTVADLDNLLLSRLNSHDSDKVQLSLPGSDDWQNIFAFSYTNARKEYKEEPDIKDYYSAIADVEITLANLKSHKLYCIKTTGEEVGFSIYECLYAEQLHEGKIHILFSRQWFTIDQDFHNRVEASLKEVPLSTISFPDVMRVKKTAAPKKTATGTAAAAAPATTKRGRKPKKDEETDGLEAEGDYNVRVAAEKGFLLMDKKTVSSRVSASPVEVCDLLTKDRKFIHAKHRSGYSGGLSHLFAQGRVAAECLLSDSDFRKAARKHLTADMLDVIPETELVAEDCEIVFLVLGADVHTVREDLPFFSKVNLWTAYRNLKERRFKVSICAADIETK